MRTRDTNYQTGPSCAAEIIAMLSSSHLRWCKDVTDSPSYEHPNVGSYCLVGVCAACLFLVSTLTDQVAYILLCYVLPASFGVD